MSVLEVNSADELLEYARKSRADNPDISVKKKNILLKSIISRIDVTSNQVEVKGEYDFSLKITLNI